MAEILFGKKKYEILVKVFNENGKTAKISELPFLLRAAGLAPTQRQLADFQSQLRNEGDQISLTRFLEFAIKCGPPSDRIPDMISFFAPYDKENTGKIPVRVFKNLLENVGECMKSSEVDEAIKIFGKGDFVEYKEMINLLCK
jgi:Ca2+-binding EF-hand superfamily protein